MNRVWRTTSALILFALGTSLITPLIPIYQERLGFSDTFVTLFLGCYVVTLIPSMLSLGQLSDRIGRKGVLLGGVATLAAAQAILVTEPGLAVLLVTRAIQGLASGAFFGTCTAFLVDAAPVGRRQFASVLGSTAIRFGLGFGPGLGGVIAQRADAPLRLPFELHLVALAGAAILIATLPETVTVRSRRPLTMRLEVPQAERSVFWRVLVPSGAMLSLFDGVGLSLIPVFLVRNLEVDNYVVVGSAGFLVLVTGAVSQLLLPRVPPEPAITWGLVVAVAGVTAIALASPAGSVSLALGAVAVTGAAAGMVFKGGLDLCTRIAPLQDRGKLVSAYLVACYTGGFSVPLLLVGVVSDLSGLTMALLALAVAAAIGTLWVWAIGLRSLEALGDDEGPALAAPDAR